jgi:VRR-NUC domain.
MKKVIKLFTDPTTEAQHQINVIRWSQINRDKYPALALLHHIPNGGARDAVEGKRLREQGVKPGVPDLCLPVPRGRYNGLYLEMKKPGGTESPEQVWWREKLTEQGYFSTVSHGWESAVQVLVWYMGLKEEQILIPTHP